MKKKLEIGHTFPNGTKVLEVLNPESLNYLLVTKFIGYTDKGEFIIATLAEGDAYIYTTYGSTIAGVIRAYEFKHQEDSIEAHIERVDSVLVEAIDSIEGQSLTFEQEEILEQMHSMRGIIND